MNTLTIIGKPSKRETKVVGLLKDTIMADARTTLEEKLNACQGKDTGQQWWVSVWEVPSSGKTELTIDCQMTVEEFKAMYDVLVAEGLIK